jgi:cytochrome c nitrite reductase small subunit
MSDATAAHRPAYRRWTIATAVAIGLALGLGAFTFVYARGASYLTNDPEACANCHIMREHLDAWVKSSHHAVATCNDCHTPHNFVGKYVTKARNGFWHSFYFTSGRFPDPLRITDGNRAVTEGACRYCHGEIVAAIDPPPRHAEASTPSNAAHAAAVVTIPNAAGEELSCIRCHRYAGHLVR